MSNLVIVESPAKAKTIKKYLGPNYEVMASMGHVRDLPKSKLSVDVDNGFKPVYVPMKDKEEVISSLKKKPPTPTPFISQRTLTVREKRSHGIWRSCWIFPLMLP